MKKIFIYTTATILIAIVILLFFQENFAVLNDENIKDTTMYNMNISEDEWKKKLTEDQYYVLRKKGTERPFTGKFNSHFEPGVYTCGACGSELFQSDSKFDSHCGWPSFYEAIDTSKVKEIMDTSHGMTRIEVVCKNCGGHLGHVFPDGPKPTGLRYCINSVSLDFKEQTKDSMP